MKPLRAEKNEYLSKLTKRAKESRVFHSHQFTGLEIATLLHDLEHKSLYIKLAKEHNPEMLLSLAKSTLERRDVKNPAAYFMTLVQNIKKGRSRPA